MSVASHQHVARVRPDVVTRFVNPISTLHGARDQPRDHGEAVEAAYQPRGESDPLAELRSRLQQTLVDLMREQGVGSQESGCQQYVQSAQQHAAAAQAALD